MISQPSTPLKDAAYALNLLAKAVELRGPAFNYWQAYPWHMSVISSEDSEEQAWSCVYFENSEPACLVGLALWLDGYTEADLAPHEGSEACKVTMELGFTEEAAERFRAAQSRQDAGDDWGDALTEAQEYDTECYDLTGKRLS